MIIKEEKGITGIDIAISIILITIFISLIGNLIVNINMNSKNTQRKSIATSYAVQEIEKSKSLGYMQDYDNKGISKKDVIREEDIYEKSGDFTGYHKTIFIEDYVLLNNDATKINNLVKKITVEISYKLGNKVQNVDISTFVAKE